MSASENHRAILAAGGEAEHISPMFANANNPPSSVYFTVLSGGPDMSVAGWLHMSYEALESKEAMDIWDEFREELYEDPALNIRRGDMLRARKLAAGQGRPRFSSARRGPSRAEQLGYRRVLRRGLQVIARLPGTTVGTALGRSASAAATTGAVLSGLSDRHARDRSSALALIRTSAVTAWYELNPGPAPAAPSLVRGEPYASAEAGGLLEATEFVAYCAYQHYARSHHRRFLWEWLPELLPGATRPLGI
ncbi:hypothetical protein KEF29_33760 [Streptomyces tuirus]|uniref:Uncharacterized protein n=1 Tax=Streptomyces tuirus TaxID=68278 RepID=A0A941FJH4_9ACTN|nr:hypothetical protein [Streptomyces tuirus]